MKSSMELRTYQLDIARRAVELLRSDHLCYLAMECRTGKTLTALYAASLYGAKSVLFISKKKAIPSIESDHRALGEPFRLTTVNYESAHKVAGFFDLVILDEAHNLGAFPKPGKRAREVRKLVGALPVIYLSGTPSPESYSQLYHQFWVSRHSPFRAYGDFYKWARTFVAVKQRKINGYTVNDYSAANKEMIDRVCRRLFIDWSQGEAGFEANIEEHVLEVPMTARTEGMLRELERSLVLRLGDSVVLGDTPAKLMGKLHQLSSGTVIDEEGRRLITDRSKAEHLRRAFRGRKLAVFYVYQSEFDLLKETFPSHTCSPEEFQAGGPGSVFLGQVRSAREGVRLDTADALVFFNLEYSFLSYEQGRNRLSSKERTNPAQVWFLCSDCGIERDIMEAVQSKKDFTYSYYKSKRKREGRQQG